MATDRSDVFHGTLEMGRVGEQPPRALLRHQSIGPEAAEGGRRQLVADLGDHRALPRSIEGPGMTAE